MLFEGKSVIVTGGARGIGRAIVLDFAREGANIVFTYLKNDDAANKLQSDAKKNSGTISGVKADVRVYDAAKMVVAETLKRFGKIDILINNAGIIRDKALMLMDPADWQEVVDTNLTGYFNMSRACIVAMMKQKSGVIINMTSVAGIAGSARQTNYSSAKAGVIGFTKSLAKEVAAYGIRVNAVAPGYIETDMTNTLKNKDIISNSIPLGRFGVAEEVAKTVAFLSSNKSSYITGGVITVDGGLVMKT